MLTSPKHLDFVRKLKGRILLDREDEPKPCFQPPLGYCLQGPSSAVGTEVSGLGVGGSGGVKDFQMVPADRVGTEGGHVHPPSLLLHQFPG